MEQGLLSQEIIQPVRQQRSIDRGHFQQSLAYRDGIKRWLSGESNNSLYLDTIQDIVQQQQTSKSRDGPKSLHQLKKRYNQVSKNKSRATTANEEKLEILYKYYKWLRGEQSRQKINALINRRDVPRQIQQYNRRMQIERRIQEEQWEKILKTCRVARILYGVSWASLMTFFKGRLPGVKHMRQSSLGDLYPYYKNLTTGFIEKAEIGQKSDQEVDKIRQLYESGNYRYQQTSKQIIKMRQIKDQDLKYFSGGQIWKKQEQRHLKQRRVPDKNKKSWFQVQGLRPDVEVLRAHITERLKEHHLQGLSEYVNKLESLDQFKAWDARLKIISGLRDDDNAKKKDDFEKLWRQVFLAYQFNNEVIRSTATMDVTFNSIGDIATFRAVTEEDMEFKFEARLDNDCGVKFDKDFPVIFKNLTFFGQWEEAVRLLQDYIKTAIQNYAPMIKNLRTQIGYPSEQQIKEIYHTKDCKAIVTQQGLQVYQLQKTKMSPSTKIFLSGIKMWWMIDHFNFLPKKYADELAVMFSRHSKDSMRFIEYKKVRSTCVRVMFAGNHVWDQLNRYTIDGAEKSPEEFQMWVIQNKGVWKKDIERIRSLCDKYIEFLVDVSNTLVSYRQERPSRFKDMMRWISGTKKNFHLNQVPETNEMKNNLNTSLGEIFTKIPETSYDDVCTRFRRFDDIILDNYSKFFNGIKFSEKVIKQLKQNNQKMNIPMIVAYKILDEAKNRDVMEMAIV